MAQPEPEKTIRNVLDACADCDTCRFLMDESCHVFPELFRLYDREKETGKPPNVDALRKLADLCTLCGLCPCPNIRDDIIRGKTERVRKDGLPLRIRMLADVQRFGRWGSLAPKVINQVLAFAPTCRVVKRIAGIHPQRNVPHLADESFFSWARKQGLEREVHQAPKVAYFAGCTAGYLFPQVARAAVHVFQRNGVSVQVPRQQCCGMPALVEGDQGTTLERVQFNLEILLKAALSGYELVCSCPTCGFLMKVLLKEGAFYSKAYQKAVNAAADEIKVPGDKDGKEGFVHLKKTIYNKILKDNSYFSSLDPLERINLSDKLLDVGEYLNRLRSENLLNTRFGKLAKRMVYYAPCHQREQGIGSPYLDLLSLIPDLDIHPVGSTLDCCGMGGSLGFKENFHEASVRLAKPLIDKIRAAEPEAVITDCLSCRLQFQHLLPYPVYHPVEILQCAYQAVKATTGRCHGNRKAGEDSPPLVEDPGFAD